MSPALPCREIVEIHDLYARYCEALDGDDPDELARCFTAEAVWTSDVIGRRIGRAAIGGLVAEMAALGEDRPFHQTTGVRLIAVDPIVGTATGQARWIALYPRRPASSFGVYRDTLERSPGGAWRFATRRLTRMSDPAAFRVAWDPASLASPASPASNEGAQRGVS